MIGKPISQTLIILLAAVFTLTGHQPVKSDPSQAAPTQLASGWEVINQNSGDRISMVSEDEGWIIEIVHNGANIYHWDGANWAAAGTVTHNQDVVRGDIAMVSTNDGWIVLGGPIQGNCSATNSSVYHWNGSAWSFYGNFTDPNGTSMSALDMLSANDGWIAATGCFFSNFYHWDGISWQFSNHSIGPLWVDNDIDMLSDSDGWGIGFTGKIGHWNGTNWNEVPSPVSTSLNAIDMVSPSDGWIVGDEGVILHWYGDDWSQVTSPVTSTLTSIDMVSVADGWITGGEQGGQESTPGVILHWNGNTWTQLQNPSTAQLFAVDMVSTNAGWITGHGATLRYAPPNLALNYSTGQPGSFFNLTGVHFPPESQVDIIVNGHPLSATLSTDIAGTFTSTLSTAQADYGYYAVTASVNPSATTYFYLSPEEPLRQRTGDWLVIDIPSGIAGKLLFLPLVLR